MGNGFPLFFAPYFSPGNNMNILKSNCDNCGRLLLDILAGTRNQYGTFCGLDCSNRFTKPLRNSLGKRVKKRRFIITRSNPTSPRPYSEYLGKSGFCTYDHAKAARYKSAADAQDEIDYFQRVYPQFVWKIETE